MKVINRLPGQPVVSGNRIGVEHLQPGIHRVLELFVIRTVHVGFMHAAAQGAHAHVPDRRHPVCGCGYGGFHLQRITSFPQGRQGQGQRFLSHLHFHPQKTEGPEQEGFVDLVTPRGNHLIPVSGNSSIYSIIAMRFDQPGSGTDGFNGIAFRICQDNPAAFAAG